MLIANSSHDVVPLSQAAEWLGGWRAQASHTNWSWFQGAATPPITKADVWDATVRFLIRYLR